MGASFARFAGIEISLFYWGPKPSELVLQTGWVSAHQVTAGVSGFPADGMRGEAARVNPFSQAAPDTVRPQTEGLSAD